MSRNKIQSWAERERTKREGIPTKVQNFLGTIVESRSGSVFPKFTLSLDRIMDGSSWKSDTESGIAARKRTHETGLTMETSYLAAEDNGKNMGISHGNTGIFVNAGIPEESHTRSLLKGVTWRILATMTTVVIAWFVTGEVAQAFKIGFVEFFAKLAIYYFHERAWAKIRI